MHTGKSKFSFPQASSFCSRPKHCGDKKVFGSGTRLYVTENGKDVVIKPTLSAYLPLKKTSGNSAMICQAQDMFPDLVKFKWEKKNSAGVWELEENDVLEQDDTSDRKTVTSMKIVNTAEDLYRCTVIHEGGTDKNPQSIELKKDKKEAEKKSNDDEPNATCPPATEETVEKTISGVSEQIPSLYLFVYAYGVMIMKNGLYVFVVFIFILKRKFGKKEEHS